MGYFTWLFAFYLLDAVLAVSNVTIYGPNFGKSLFEELRRSFSLSRSYDVEYININQQTTAGITARLDAGEPVVVGSLDGIPNGSLVLPMFGFPITVVHNVPIADLNLSQSVLLDIYLGRIRWWNHTNLTDLNSGLPTEPIFLVVGSLLNRLAEAMTVIANRTITVNDVGSNSINVLQLVCPTVKARPFSLGSVFV